jgi:hypothetical protein
MNVLVQYGIASVVHTCIQSVQRRSEERAVIRVIGRSGLQKKGIGLIGR